MSGEEGNTDKNTNYSSLPKTFKVSIHDLFKNNSVQQGLMFQKEDGYNYDDASVIKKPDTNNNNKKSKSLSKRLNKQGEGRRQTIWKDATPIYSKKPLNKSKKKERQIPPTKEEKKQEQSFEEFLEGNKQKNDTIIEKPAIKEEKKEISNFEEPDVIQNILKKDEDQKGEANIQLEQKSYNVEDSNIIQINPNQNEHEILQQSEVASIQQVKIKKQGGEKYENIFEQNNSEQQDIQSQLARRYNLSKEYRTNFDKQLEYYKESQVDHIEKDSQTGRQQSIRPIQPFPPPYLESREREFNIDQSCLKSIWSQFTLNTYDGQRFLMNAKKTSVFPTTTFTITRKQGNFKEASDDCLGTVQANWFGDVLNVFGRGLRPSEARKKNQVPRELLATIVYETKILPSGTPRKFTVYALKPYVRYNRDFPEVRKSGGEIPLHTLFDANDGNKKNIAKYKNREPKWIKGCKAYMLNLGPKAKEPAVQNFILEELPVQKKNHIEQTKGILLSLQHHNEDISWEHKISLVQRNQEVAIEKLKNLNEQERDHFQSNRQRKNSISSFKQRKVSQNREVMLFSKQSKGRFLMTFQIPLSEYLAFAIALSNFTKRVIGQ